MTEKLSTHGLLAAIASAPLTGGETSATVWIEIEASTYSAIHAAVRRLEMTSDGVMTDAQAAAFGREFAAWLFAELGKTGVSEWAEEVLEIAARHGLAERVAYDPVRHGEVDVEPGDIIWWWAGLRDQ